VGLKGRGHRGHTARILARVGVVKC
jgi:hypothetical protein